MDPTSYQIEIVIIGGPMGYHYEDNYFTSISCDKFDVTIQGKSLNDSIKKECMERSRKFFLYTFINNERDIREIVI